MLTITDTDSARHAVEHQRRCPPPIRARRPGTYGVFVTQTSGDMQVNRILTNGDASLVALNGALRDARGGGLGDNTQFSLANVEANNIDLGAYCSVASSVPDCGDIGARGPPIDGLGNDFKIDSGHGDTQNPSTVIVGRVGIEAQSHISVTETIGALNVLHRPGTERQRPADGARARGPGRRPQPDPAVRVRHGRADARTANAILVDYSGVANVARTISASSATVVTNSASINAQQGWILLRAGDNVTLGGLDPSFAPSLDRRAADRAEHEGRRRSVDRHPRRLRRVLERRDQLDDGFGTVMHLHGTITPGRSRRRASNEINPGRDCNVTRIFGNTDTDTITFDQTYPRRPYARLRLASHRPARRTSQLLCGASTRRRRPGLHHVNGLQTMFDPVERGRRDRQPDDRRRQIAGTR